MTLEASGVLQCRNQCKEAHGRGAAVVYREAFLGVKGSTKYDQSPYEVVK